MAYSTRSPLTYLNDLDLYRTEKPYVCTIAPWSVPDAKRGNLSLSPHEMEIRDMRDILHEFATNKQGFAVIADRSTISNMKFGDDAYIREFYYPQCKALLKTFFGAEEIHIFDHTFRDSAVQKDDPSQVKKQLTGEDILKPAYDVHVDQTPESVNRRIHSVYGEQASGMMKRRARIINIWRPLVSLVEEHPIAVCDYRSTDPHDFIATDLPSPYWIGELFLLKHNPNHRWYFLKDMTEDEVLVLKCYDSAATSGTGNIALATPHTAFDWKDGPANPVPRRSLEVRALIFSDPDCPHGGEFLP